MKDYYTILGVAECCSFAELKKAFYAAAKRCHPDRFGNSPAKTAEFQELVAAFDILSDPDRRREYDASKLDSMSSIAAETHADGDAGCILDCEASDILEELIVGNDAPPETSLATLLADLEKTDVFIAYREGKNAFRLGDCRSAAASLLYAVGRAPGNIVFRVHLARAFAAMRQFRKARYHYNCAIAIGEKRVPRQSMANVRFELAEMRKNSRPWLWKFLGIGDSGGAPVWYADAGDAMCAELARCMNREARRELRASSDAADRVRKLR